MKKKLSIVLAGILFLAGLSLLLYPLVANQWNNYRQSRLISEYESVVKEPSIMKRNGSGPMRITSLFFQASFPILSQSQQHPISPVRNICPV